MTASKSSASSGRERRSAKKASTRNGRVSKTLQRKARAILAFAADRAGRCANWVELHNAVFGPGGKANELLKNEAERTAFTKTAENKHIYALLDTLPAPPVKAGGAPKPRQPGSAIGKLTIVAEDDEHLHGFPK